MKHTATLISILKGTYDSIYDKVFIVPKAGILIPVLPDKSRGIFYTASHSILFTEFHKNFWVAG